MTKKAAVVGVVLAGVLAAGRASAAPTAVEYAIPADLGLASGQVARLNVVNGDGGVAVGDVNGRTCQVEINWGDAQGQPLFPSPTTLTLSPGQSAFLDLPFDAAAAAGTLTGNRVMVRPLMQGNCDGGTLRSAGSRVGIPVWPVPGRNALIAIIEVYDADTGRSTVVFNPGVRVRFIR